MIEVIADLTKDCDVRRLVRTTIEEFGRLNVLINNANVSGVSGCDDPKSAYIFDHMMHVNVRAAFLLWYWLRSKNINCLIINIILCPICSQLCIPHLEITRGNIVNVSSRAATNPVCLNHQH